MTGYDFSPAPLAVARDLAARCRLQDASFVEGELYDAPLRELAGPPWHLFQEDPRTGRCVPPQGFAIVCL